MHDAAPALPFSPQQRATDRLFQACRDARLLDVRDLLESEADVHRVDHVGDTPLHALMRWSHALQVYSPHLPAFLDVLEIAGLGPHTLSVPSDGTPAQFPINLATDLRNWYAVGTLLERGAHPVNEPEHRQVLEEVLRQAVSTAPAWIVAALLDRGLSVDLVVDPMVHQAPLLVDAIYEGGRGSVVGQVTLTRVQQERLEVVDLLLERGAVLDGCVSRVLNLDEARDHDDSTRAMFGTALTFAFMHSPAVVPLLLDHGAWERDACWNDPVWQQTLAEKLVVHHAVDSLEVLLATLDQQAWSQAAWYTLAQRIAVQEDLDQADLLSHDGERTANLIATQRMKQGVETILLQQTSRTFPTEIIPPKPRL